MEQLPSEKVKLNARFFVIVVAINQLDNCDDKAFSIHKLWLLSGGGRVSD